MLIDTPNMISAIFNEGCTSKLRDNVIMSLH